MNKQEAITMLEKKRWELLNDVQIGCAPKEVKEQAKRVADALYIAIRAIEREIDNGR